MRQYLELIQSVLDRGVDRSDRTGVGTRALFAQTMRFDMAEGFPAVTTKKLAWKAVVSELLWFLEGSGDENRLKKILGKDKTIWSANAVADYWKPRSKFDGDLGRIYGVQWRSWQTADGKTIDQVQEAVRLIKEDPDSRRIIITAWNPGEIPQMALPPCHMFCQFFVDGKKLHLSMYQRSCDLFLGVPFNIASYALFLHMMARITGKKAGEFIHILGDAHIYHNHYDQIKEQLSRTPKKLPALWLNPDVKKIDDYTMDDIRLDNYEYHPPIKAEMAV